MTRDLVFKVIDEERMYQEKMAADENRPDMAPVLSVGETILAIQHNVNQAASAWYTGANPHESAMEHLRKIAALCVQAGEHFGMPSRK